MTGRLQQAADERRELAEFLETITDEQWASPSLVAGLACC